MSAARPSVWRQPWARWKYVVQSWGSQHKELPGAVTLMRQSWRTYRDNLGYFIKLAAVVALPAAIVSTYMVDPAADTAFAAYVAFAQLAMNTALLYAVVQLAKGKKVSVKQAYYDGSALLVRLILFSFITALVGLLVLFGVLIFAYGIVAPGTILSGVEKYLLTLLSAVVLIPGLLLLARISWGALVIASTDLGPWEATRKSWSLTRGKVVMITLRAFVWVLVLGFVVGLPAAFLLGLASWAQLGFLTVIVQTVLTSIVVPLLILYLYSLYQGFAK